MNLVPPRKLLNLFQNFWWAFWKQFSILTWWTFWSVELWEHLGIVLTFFQNKTCSNFNWFSKNNYSKAPKCQNGSFRAIWLHNTYTHITNANFSFLYFHQNFDWLIWFRITNNFTPHLLFKFRIEFCFNFQISCVQKIFTVVKK